mgnify:FL=1
MKKLLTLALISALPVMTFAGAQSVPLTVYALDEGGAMEVSLNPDASGQAIVVPLAELGGTLPADLQLAVEADQLPPGDTLTLNSVTSDAQNAYLHVSYHHAPGNAGLNGEYYVNALPSFKLLSSGQTLTSIWLPVTTQAADLPDSIEGVDGAN